MPQQPGTASILVTGATGNLGREVVDRLVAREVPVRALVRRPLPPRPGVEIVLGDLTRPAEVRAALTGVDAVLLVWPLLDAGPGAALAETLAEHDVRVVYLSSTAVRDGHARQSDPIAQVHADLEHLLRTAGVGPAVLRSDTLASNARGWIPQLAAGDEVSGPEVARTPVVDERDVADAVVAALLAPPDSLRPSPYLLTGPEPLTRAEQVSRLGAVLGRPLRFRALSADDARARLLADGRPKALVEALLGAALHRPPTGRTTDDVALLTGHPARSFATWAADHADELR